MGLESFLPSILFEPLRSFIMDYAESMNQDEISFSDVIAYLEAHGRWLLLG